MGLTIGDFPLLKQKTWADNLQRAWKSNDSLAYQTSSDKLEKYSDLKYSLVLEVFPITFVQP
jgi:hypothetical protein